MLEGPGAFSAARFAPGPIGRIRDFMEAADVFGTVVGFALLALVLEELQRVHTPGSASFPLFGARSLALISLAGSRHCPLCGVSLIVIFSRSQEARPPKPARHAMCTRRAFETQ